MLDIKLIRENEPLVRQKLESRGQSDLLDGLIGLDKRRRELIETSDSLKAKRNELTKEIAEAGKRGEIVTALKDQSRAIGQDINKHDDELKEELQQRCKRQGRR